MIVLFLLHLFIHLNGIKCNEIKNLTSKVENGIVATKGSIWHDSHAFYQSTSKQRRKRANTPPRRSRSRSPMRTPGPNDQQRTPPLQLQLRNPFGILPFQPPPPITGQPFMPQPIAGAQPPIGQFDQMRPPIGGQHVGQMPMQISIMPQAFGPPQQSQFVLQPQNIPQHRSPIAHDGPPTTSYDPLNEIRENLQIAERAVVQIPQPNRSPQPEIRGVFDDLHEYEMLQRTVQNRPQIAHQEQNIRSRPPTRSHFEPLTPDEPQQPQASQIRVLAPEFDPALEQYQLRQQQLHEQQFQHQYQYIPQHQSPIANIQRVQSPHVQAQNIRSPPHVRAPEIPAERPQIRLVDREQAALDELYRRRNAGYDRAIQRDRNDPNFRWNRERMQNDDLIAGIRGLNTYGHVPMNYFYNAHGISYTAIKREFNERRIPVYPYPLGGTEDRVPFGPEYNLAQQRLLEHLDRRDTIGSPAAPANARGISLQANVHQQLQNQPHIVEEQNIIPQSSRSSGSSEIIYIPPSPEQQRSSTRNLWQSQVHVHPRRAPTPIEQMQRQLYMRHIPAEVYPHLAHFRMSDRNQDRIVEYFRHARPRNLQNDVEIQQAFHNLAAVGVRPGMLAQHYREQPIDVIRDILGRPTSPDRILALPESGEGHINRQMLTLAWDHLRDVYPDLPPLSAFEAGGAGGSGTGGSSAAMGPGGSGSTSHQDISRPTAAMGQRVGGSESSASQAAVGSSSVSQAQNMPNTRPRLSESEIQDFYARVLGATQHPPPQQQADIRPPQQGQPRGDISAIPPSPPNVPPTTKRRHRHRSNSAPSHPSRGRLSSRSSHADRLHSQQQRYMRQFPTNTRLSDRAQHRIVQDLLQSRRSGQLTRAEIHQDMRNLIEVGVRPHVLFDHYQIPADERRHYRINILNRPITPVELNALPEPSSPGMDRDMQRTTWNRLRRKHYPNLPSPSTSPSAAASQRPMAIPHQPHAVHQQSPPRGGIGAIHPSPNVQPRTRKRPRSNSVPSRFSGGGPSPSKRGRFGRRKKRNVQFA